MEATGGQSVTYHLQQTNFRWSELLFKVATKSETNSYVSCGVQMMFRWYFGTHTVWRKYPPQHYSSKARQNLWYKAGRIFAFVFFLSSSDLTIWTLQLKSRDHFFVLLELLGIIAPALEWNSAAHLLQGLVWCTNRDIILHSQLLMRGYLIDCWVCQFSPGIYSKRFCPNNCYSLEISFLSDYSLGQENQSR